MKETPIKRAQASILFFSDVLKRPAHPINQPLKPFQMSTKREILSHRRMSPLLNVTTQGVTIKDMQIASTFSL
ncbi:hypothetical protein L596_019246 [Steinernema carpocapsae]|uniref:Uncharacterized protein n=1 Tax=Steinernema carpocapsae TaxID=34508 RepID=A0A4U5MPT4_STECR|nr:hypothetical protein L596_019246 [Steinernema carpocapsae]